MNNYIVLCNRHLSIYGDSVALFWGSDLGKSKGCYSSDLRNVYLYNESEIKGQSDVIINIKDINMTKEDFDRLRAQKFPVYLVKDYIMKNTNISRNVICEFERERDEEKELNEKYGYCSCNGTRCVGLECEVSDVEDEHDWLYCSDRVSMSCNE